MLLDFIGSMNKYNFNSEGVIVKKFALVLCTVGLVLISASSSFARIWNDSKIELNGQYLDCGYTPSIALLYGVQPVVSNYDQRCCSYRSVVHQTAFGWEEYSIAPGYIAGNGNRSIVSFDTPVTFGQDGHFYGTTHDYPLQPICLEGGTGPEWQSDICWPYSIATADAAGTIYMAEGNIIARCTGSVWSEHVQLDLAATDIAVSSFGDIAVSGSCRSNGSKCVAWFDFKSARWMQRELTLSDGQNNWAKVDVEWDKSGNLGVAYYDYELCDVKFDYLNMETGSWTSEVVKSYNQYSSCLGAALAFDRFGNPVIACGEDIYYDPVSTPEPSTILALITGVLGLAWSGRIYGAKRN
ncbi:MAG: hypothetical protein ABFD54_13935 [Armatimonadota bacterium]|nr:hypothetical protein [bacterium]